MPVGLILAFLALASGIAANEWIGLRPLQENALAARGNGGSFTPGTKPGTGSSCGNAFGAGFAECAASGVCYNPLAGDTCCSDGYPCPEGSFCLAAGKCCPNGMSREACAAKLSITLSSSSTSRATSSLQPAITTKVAVPAQSPDNGPASKAVVVTTVTICPKSTSAPPYSVVPSSPTTPSAVIPTTSVTSPPLFTGAASQNVINGVAVIVAILGHML